MADPKKPVATPIQREVVIGAAAIALEAAANSVQNLVGNLRGEVDDLSLRIANKTVELAGLEQSYQEKERALVLNTQMTVREKGMDAVTAMLRAVNKEAISTEELVALKANYAGLQASLKDDLQRGIGAAVGMADARHTADKQLLEAKHAQDQAENRAKIASQTDQITLLKEQLENITKQLDAERAAGVQRAQANVAPVVNVGQGR